MSSVVVNTGTKLRLYNKGAAEWVLKRCTHLLNTAGGLDTMDEKSNEHLLSIVTDMAKRGLRCICLTYTDYELEDMDR
jgi:Ca2+-transporting ATPase